MKFKFGILAFSALAFFACNPLEDVYEQIDQANDPNKQIVNTYDEYVLTEADYVTISKAAKAAAGDDAVLVASAAAVATECALNENVDKMIYIPQIVEALVPTWQSGSVVNVTYNFSNGITEMEKEYASVESFNVSDYGDGNTYFSPSNAASALVPAALKAQFPEATQGAKVAVSYKYSSVDAGQSGGNGGDSGNGNGGNGGDDSDQGTGSVTLPSTGFDGQTVEENIAIDGWKNIAVKGDRAFIAKEYTENFYTQISGYDSAATEKVELEAWLIMPKTAIQSGMTVSFVLKYGHPKGSPSLKVMVSENYSGGDSVDGDWTDITSKFTYPALPESGYSASFESVGNGDLSQFAGKEVYVALCYTGSKVEDTTTFQIDDFAISAAPKSAAMQKATVETETLTDLYAFNGTDWAKDSAKADLILLSAADYDSMGTDGPGSHDNFSSSLDPTYYLPIFLANNYPYAAEGDVKAVIYKYYAGGVSNKIEEFVFNGTHWVVNTNITVCEKETFIKADGEWMFDPALLYSLVTDDYNVLVEWVKENKTSYMDPKYSNSEWWFGSSSHYNNFNIQLVKRHSYDADGVLDDMTDEAATLYCKSMIYEAISAHILPLRFASAPSVDAAGGDQIVRVSCTVYDGANYTYVIDFKVLGGGEFEYVSHIVK